MSKTQIVVMIVLSVFMWVGVAFLVIAFINHYNDVFNRPVSVPVNRDDYILYSFELRESSGNALSTDEGSSQSLTFSFESIYIDTPQTKSYMKIELDEATRKSLEAQLLNLIEEHSLWDWNGFDEHLEVMDTSNGFSFHVNYKNGDEIKASGGFIFPDNYGIVFSEAKEIFLKYVN